MGIGSNPQSPIPNPHRNKFDFINIIQIKNNYKNKVKYNKEINFK